MILTDKELKEALERGKQPVRDSSQEPDAKLASRGWIRIDPSPKAVQFGSCSIDLRLGQEFMVFKHSRVPYIDIRSADSNTFMQTEKHALEHPMILQPKEFVLASTLECVTLADDILAQLEGRSSLGRLGIIVHATAGIIDPGWHGNIVLELANHNNMAIAVYPHMQICSLTFHRLSGPVEVPYRLKPGRKYAGQRGPVGSLISRDSGLQETQGQWQHPIPGLFESDQLDEMEEE